MRSPSRTSSSPSTRPGAPAASARSLGFLTWLAAALFWGPVPVAEAIPRCEQLLEAAAISAVAEAKTTLSLSGLNGLAGNFDTARRLFGESAAALEELGLNFALATGRQLAGMTEMLAGDPAAAERELRLGFDALQEMGQLGYAVGAAVYLARALLELERFDEASELAEFAGSTAPAEDLIAHAHRDLLLARIAAARGSAAEQVERAGAAAAVLGGTDELITHADALSDLGTILEAAGEEDAARAARERARALYARKGVDPAPTDAGG